MLGCGTAPFLRGLHADVPANVGLIYCVTGQPSKHSPRGYKLSLERQVSSLSRGLGLNYCLIRHADFGGCTDAQHLVLWNNVISDDQAFTSGPSTPKVLADVIDPIPFGEEKG